MAPKNIRNKDIQALKVPSGVQLIMAERERQVSVKGWTPRHDDEHDGGEMALAAECYLKVASGSDGAAARMGWPWDYEWWKPSDDPVRNLTKAGALIAAEIDRLLRERQREAVK